MNLAIRGIDCNIGPHNADSFHNDLHKDLKADYILANPPFNISDWGGERLRDDVRWQHGAPPVGNANYAWIQHFIHHLSPCGVAGFVLANGSLSTSTGAELDIRKSIVEADLVDCIVAMPGQLFYSTQIPVCLWFFARSKTQSGHRARNGETLLIDARKLGGMVDRVHRELSDEDIKKIANAYHAYRGEEGCGEYEDVKGFCKAAKLDDIREHEYILTPGRYVGIEDAEDDGAPFDEKMENLTSELAEQFAKSAHLEQRIRENLKLIGYEI
jgi:type I restriction enzyme M protein